MAHTTHTASPVKLRTGAWGAKTDSPVAEGDTIEITTRSGKTWEAQVEKVIWSDGQVCIVATASAARAATTRTSPARATYNNYCGYPCPVSGRRCCARLGPCHDCQ